MIGVKKLYNKKGGGASSTAFRNLFCRVGKIVPAYHVRDARIVGVSVGAVRAVTGQEAEVKVHRTVVAGVYPSLPQPVGVVHGRHHRDFPPVEIEVALPVRGEQHLLSCRTVVGDHPEEFAEGTAVLVFYRDRIALSQFPVQLVKQAVDGRHVQVLGLEAARFLPVLLEKEADFKDQREGLTRSLRSVGQIMDVFRRQRGERQVFLRCGGDLLVQVAVPSDQSVDVGLLQCVVRPCEGPFRTAGGTFVRAVRQEHHFAAIGTGDKITTDCIYVYCHCFLHPLILHVRPFKVATVAYSHALVTQNVNIGAPTFGAYRLFFLVSSPVCRSVRQQ